MMPPWLHPLSNFVDREPANPDRWDYLYQGYCPQTGRHHSLPRTALAQAVAQGLMAQLAAAIGADRPGKMIGVLLVQTPTGQRGVLKAFSGEWQGQQQWPGWVPPMAGRDRVALQEAETLHQLDTIKTQLLDLQQRPERQHYRQLREQWAQQRLALQQRHRQRRADRAQQRQSLASTLTGAALATALARLDQESRRDKAELRSLKQAQAQQLAPLEEQIKAMDGAISTLKGQRQELSRQLQRAMQAAYTLTNFAGDSLTLQQLSTAGGLPTGTGDCCAPKLLQFAARQGLRPLALAEFWWGQAQGDRRPGVFYGACAERCQPIMGFLLAGLPGARSAVLPQPRPSLPILYADDRLLVVDKPAGLLSVPGRYRDRQDSVLTRLRHTQPDGDRLQAVHRLDQDTSGVLVLARDPVSHRALSQQFEQRRVAKTYEALLDGVPGVDAGLIDLPLWGNPAQRPRQWVDWQQGKPSQTRFEVLARGNGTSRVRFFPLTGRSHQLRVHAAHPQGLNAPICGDRLYGQTGQRLYLHASRLECIHPQTQRAIAIEAPLPF